MRDLERPFFEEPTKPAELPATLERKAEEPQPEKKYENLISKESSLLERLADRIKEQKDSKIGKKISRNLLRAAYAIELSTLLAHGAFAQEAKHSEAQDTTTTQTADSVKGSWLNQIAGEVSVSYNAESREQRKPSEIATFANTRDINFEKLDKKQWQALDTYFDTVVNDSSITNFYKTLEQNKENWDQEQKLFFVQMLSHDLNKIYDKSELRAHQYYNVSDEHLLETLHNYYWGSKIQAGICSTDHSFVADAAAALGIESWVQNGQTILGGHAFTGLLLKHDGKNEIAFVDYGSVIMTGTENYRDALGIVEKYHERIVFAGAVSDPGIHQMIGLPLSRAQQKIHEVSGYQEVDSIAENEDQGQKISRRLEINLGRETQELKIEHGLIGLDFVNYRNTNDYFNSLAELQSLRLNGRTNIKGVHLMGNVAEIHMGVKTLRGDTLAVQKMMIANFAADYFKDKTISRNKYGEFAGQVGLVAQASIYSGAEVSGKLIYINPSETGKFYIQAEQIEQTRGLGPRYGMEMPQGTSKFKIGGSVKVRPAEIVNFEAEMKKSISSENYSASAEFITDNFTFEVHGRKDISNLPTLNSGQAVEVEIGKKFVANNVPQGELNLYWSTGSEREQQTNNAPKFGLKARVYLW